VNIFGTDKMVNFSPQTPEIMRLMFTCLGLTVRAFCIC